MNGCYEYAAVMVDSEDKIDNNDKNQSMRLEFNNRPAELLSYDCTK